ncbi:MAG: nitroreductase family protein, partial [Bacteroidales bacterium]
HSLFPASKLHAIKREKLPTAEQILLLCQSRRSNRAFSKVEIPVSTLDLILEAAHRAPTAMNSQQVYFTLITNPKDLQKISKFTIDTFCGLMKKMEHPLLKPLLKPFLGGVYKMLPKFRKLKAEYDQGKDLILRNATAVILIHTPIESRFGCQDANLAYQNASLMAESLCVGHFYMGFVCTAFQQDKKNKFIQSLGIKGKVHAAMALGMPEFMFTRYIDKQDISVQKIK